MHGGGGSGCGGNGSRVGVIDSEDGGGGGVMGGDVNDTGIMVMVL